MNEIDRRDAALSVLHRYRQGQAGLAEDALAELKAVLAGAPPVIEGKDGPFNPEACAERIERTARIVRVSNKSPGIYDCLPDSEIVVLQCFHKFEVERLIAFLRAHQQQPPGKT